MTKIQLSHFYFSISFINFQTDMLRIYFTFKLLSFSNPFTNLVNSKIKTQNSISIVNAHFCICKVFNISVFFHFFFYVMFRKLQFLIVSKVKAIREVESFRKSSIYTLSTFSVRLVVDSR